MCREEYIREPGPCRRELSPQARVLRPSAPLWKIWTVVGFFFFLIKAQQVLSPRSTFTWPLCSCSLTPFKVTVDALICGSWCVSATMMKSKSNSIDVPHWVLLLLLTSFCRYQVGLMFDRTDSYCHMVTPVHQSHPHTELHSDREGKRKAERVIKRNAAPEHQLLLQTTRDPHRLPTSPDLNPGSSGC